jgi:hypothetical protein
MGSGHSKQRALSIVLAFLANWLATGRVAAEPRVVCVDPEDSQLVARIQGQTRDLSISIEWVREPSSGAPAATQLADLARRSAADFVVNVQPSAAGGLTVYVYGAAHATLRQREVPPPHDSERLAASTMAETAALIVRGELSAALASAKEEADAQTHVPAKVPVVAPQKPPPPAQPPAQPEARLDEHALSLAASIRVSAPGAGLVLGGARLGVRYRWSAVELGVAFGTTLPAELKRDALSVSLRRHDAQLEAFGQLRLARELLLLLGAGAGVVVYTRTTRSTDSSSMKTPDQATWSALLGPIAELRWRFAHSVAATARVGVDFILQPTHFTARNPDGTSTSLGNLAPFEPWAALGLVVDIWE